MTRKAAIKMLTVEVRELLREHDIVVSRDKFVSSVGRAWVDERNRHRIKVPPLTTIQNIYVVFHEIAHAILGHYEDISKTDYIQEYEAERWALNKLKEFDIHKHFPEDYIMAEKSAKMYVFSYMIKEEGEIRTSIKNWILKF